MRNKDFIIEKVILHAKQGCENCKKKKNCESFNELKEYFKAMKKHYSKFPEKPEVIMSYDSKHIMIPGLMTSGFEPSFFWIQLQLDNGYFMNYIPQPDYKPGEPANCMYV